MVFFLVLFVKRPALLFWAFFGGTQNSKIGVIFSVELGAPEAFGLGAEALAAGTAGAPDGFGDLGGVATLEAGPPAPAPAPGFEISATGSFADSKGATTLSLANNADELEGGAGSNIGAALESSLAAECAEPWSTTIELPIFSDVLELGVRAFHHHPIKTMLRIIITENDKRKRANELFLEAGRALDNTWPAPVC